MALREDYNGTNVDITGGLVDAPIGTRSPQPVIASPLISRDAAYLSSCTVIDGRLIIAYLHGTLPSAMASTDTTYDFQREMTPGDFIMLQWGGQFEYITVGALDSGTTYAITRDSTSETWGALDWPENMPYIILGAAGAGRLELSAEGGAPRLRIIEQGATADAETTLGVLGELNGHYGITTSTIGLGLGEYATGKANLTYDPSNGLRLRIYNTDYIQLDTAGNALVTNKLQLKGASSALAIGSTPPTSASAGTGVWLDRTGLYALTSNAARTVVNDGGLRVARDSNGLRFVSDSNILTDTDATDGRIFHQSSDGALVIKAPSGYLNIDVGKAALRANISGTPAFWKLLSKGSSSPGDANSNVQLAFGTSSNNYVMLEQASGKPLLNLYLGTGSSPQRQGGFFHQQTAPTYVPLYRMVSLNVAASGGTGYIGSEDYGDGTYIKFAHVMLVGFKVSDGTSQMWCYGSLYKPSSSYNAIYFTTDRGAVSATSGEHFVFLNSSGQLAIRNNSGSAFHYIGWAVTTQK